MSSESYNFKSFCGCLCNEILEWCGDSNKTLLLHRLQNRLHLYKREIYESASFFVTPNSYHLVSHIVVSRWEMATTFVLFFFLIKPLRGFRLPVLGQCPKSLIPGIRQVAVFPIGPKMKSYQKQKQMMANERP